MKHRKSYQQKQSDYCSQTGKSRFRDAREATRRLQELRNQARDLDAQGIEHTIHVVRKYYCAMCQGWHLTSWKDYGPPVAVQTPTRKPDLLLRSVAAAVRERTASEVHELTFRTGVDQERQVA